MRLSPGSILLTALVGLLLTGCQSGYTLTGRAVESSYGDAGFVSRDNQLIVDAPGIPGARVRVYRNPDRGDRELVASGRSDLDGSINLPVSAFGAGWMQEQWEIEVFCNGFETVTSRVTFPRSSGSRWLLVTMRKGRAIEPLPADPAWEQYEQFK